MVSLNRKYALTLIFENVWQKVVCKAAQAVPHGEALAHKGMGLARVSLYSLIRFSLDGDGVCEGESV